MNFAHAAPRRAYTGNSSEPKQGRAAPLHRDAPRHHRHHDVSAADGRRPRHAHVARQLSIALQVAGGSNCQCRLALPVRGPNCSLSPPPLPIETEPPVSTGCGATLAVPAHAGHHGCIRAALSCALEQRATVAPTCHLASPAASRSRRSPPSLGTATAPVPAAAVAFRFLPTARPDPRRATPPTHKHGHTPRHRRP